MAVTDGVMNTLLENVVNSEFVIDLRDFARVCITIIGVLHRSHVSQTDVVQDFGIDFSCCLVVRNLF